MIKQIAFGFCSVLVIFNAVDRAGADQLAKVTVGSELVDDGRAMVTVERGNYLIVDSVPPLGGPNIALNPTELLVGGLATCATFVAKTTLESEKLAFAMVTATAEGDFNPKSVKTGEGDPSFKAFRIQYDIPSIDRKTQDLIKKTLPNRCPVYATLTKASKIDVTFEKAPAAPAADGLATVTVSSKIYKDGSRAHIHSRNHFLVVDSVPPLGGKNETLNPIDLVLSAQATCVLFVAEASAKKTGGVSDQFRAQVTGHFDARGVKGENVNPRIQKIEVNLEAPGLSPEDKKTVIADINKRCPIITTLKKSADIVFQ